MAAASAVLVSIGVPGAGAFGAGGADAASGAPAVVTGTVERLHLDLFGSTEAPEADELTFVHTDAGAVQVPASDLAGVADGSTVRVGLASTDGVRITSDGAASTTPPADEALDPEAGADVSSVQVVAEPAAGLVDTGTSVAAPTAALEAGAAKHQVLVVVVTPAGGSASSVTASTVAGVINGAVDNYWTTVTGGVVGFAATAHPSVVTTTSTPCSNGSVSGSYTFWDEVASKTGWTQGAGKHLLVYFKALAACGGVAGLGTVGSGTSSGGILWSNGYATTGVLGHELGHNLGLGHSQELDCTADGVRVMDAQPAQCAKRSYWDTNDIMAVSWQNQGFLNASHLRRLGVLDPGAEIAPTDSGQVSLAPLSTNAGQRVLTLSDGATKYVVEYRAAVGLDAWMATSPGWGAPGVTVRREFDQATVPSGSYFPAHESFVLDGDPASADSSFGAIRTVVPVGSWISLAQGRMAIRVVSQSGSGALIDYRYGAGPVDVPVSTPVTPVATTPVTPPAPPSLTRPMPRLVNGKLRVGRSNLVVPVTWTWTVANPTARPVVRKATSATTIVTPLKGWRTVAYRATAYGTTGVGVSPVGQVRTRYLAENVKSAVRYSKGWKSTRVKGAVGSAVRSATKRNATVAIRFTGRSVGVVLQRGARNGRVAIYLDGRRVAVVNMRSKSAGSVLAWSTVFPTVRGHSVKVINLSGGSRGQIGFDGLVTLV